MRDGRTDRTGSPRRNIGTAERLLTAATGTALVAYAFGRRTRGALALGAVGGGLLARAAVGFSPLYAATGVSTARRLTGPLRVRAATTINASPEHLYAYWRNVSNLPLLLDHLARVAPIDERRSRWVAFAPGGRELSWEAEVVADTPPHRIGWRSITGSWLQMTGEITFQPIPHDRGTEVRLSLSYLVPGGRLGAAVASLFGREPGVVLSESLRRFKQAIETGEIATTQGQPTARHELRAAPATAAKRAADMLMMLRKGPEMEVRP